MAERLAQQVLQPQDSVAAATAQLQLALERSYKQQQDRVEAEQTQQAADANRLAAAVACRKVNLQIAGLQDYQSVFEGVVDYVCCAMDVAARAAAEPAARAHVSAAVESAFPLSGVAYFLTLPAQERLQQMEALARVTCGICLHNAAAGAAAGPPLLPPSAAAQLPHAQHLLAAIQGAAAEAQAALAHHNSASAAPGSGSGGGHPRLGAALFCCQAAVALRRLAADLSAGISCCHALDEGLAAALAQASRVVSNSLSGVAKAAVFPLFESAGRLHLALTGAQTDACAALTAAAANVEAGVPKAVQRLALLVYGGSLYGFSSSAALQAFADAPATTLDAVFQAVRSAPLLAHTLDLTSTAAAAAAAAGTAAAAAGTAVAARPKVGSAGSGHAGSRASSGAEGVAAAGGVCAVLPLRRLMALVSMAPVKVDAEAQTPTHFAERLVDVDYEWNEWALRRRIIALANLCTKATHSTQTALSHFRRDGDSQTWLPKAAAVQTKVNKSSSMPRKLRYVAGLRGAPEAAKMKVVSLELDIGQTHQF
ncbi:hypothetical protein COO60DRAFT_1702373 [Scenedesmus sp. NREL 46B-D3]|nr:hypothetical protein COO60DRAFT_1702373 [Scenedesmus sp. NREL 46B-D3]